MPELILTNDHRYLLDGKGIDGLTSTIKEAGLIRNSDPKYMESGSAIHKITELYDLGIMDKYEIDPKGLPYLESWKRFRKDQNYTPLHIEFQIYHPQLMVGMKIDRLPGPIDLKSGTSEPWHILQIAVQYKTIQIHNLYDCSKKIPMDIYLDPDGGPPKVKTYTPSEMREAFRIYCSMLVFVRWKRERGIK